MTCRFTLSMFVSFAFPSICCWRKSELLMCRFCGRCAKSGVWIGFSDFVTKNKTYAALQQSVASHRFEISSDDQVHPVYKHIISFYLPTAFLNFCNRQRIKRSTSAVDSAVVASETSYLASRLIVQHVFQWHVCFMSNAPVAMLFLCLVKQGALRF